MALTMSPRVVTKVGHSCPALVDDIRRHELNVCDFDGDLTFELHDARQTVETADHRRLLIRDSIKYKSMSRTNQPLDR